MAATVGAGGRNRRRLAGAGRFQQSFAQCHTLFDSAGQKSARTFTGANRTDLNYLLENILDPTPSSQTTYARPRSKPKRPQPDAL